MTLLAATALTTALVSCSKSKTNEPTDTTVTTTTSTTIQPTYAGPLPSLAAAEIATFDTPVGMAAANTTSDLFVIEQPGRVVKLRDGATAEVLDISDQVLFQGEQGLLGIAVSPDDKFLYLHYSGKDDDGATHIDEWSITSPGVIDASSQREVLRVEQPYSNHNGGRIAFGPDGYLYIGLGDGGSANDPEGRAQDLSTLLGKLLRIDPRPGAEGRTYSIPDDNPFVNTVGARPEIYAYGLRNPWQFSFDVPTETIWIGDVGQNEIEEIDAVPLAELSGANFGWDLREGSTRFEGDAPPGAIEPITEYTHDRGRCSITGGYVYRGSAIPSLRGVYLFADVCVPELLGISPRASTSDGIHIFEPTIAKIVAFGQDQNGEVFVFSQDGGMYQLSAN